MPEAPVAPAAASPGAPADLRRCIRDLVALSTLPALWTHAEPEEIAEQLGDALLAILGCDFVYIRLNAATAAGRPPDFACARGQRKEEALRFLRPLVEPYLGEIAGSEAIAHLQLDAERRARVSVHWFGHGPFGGTLVAGSAREDFPTELQRLALGVGVNQAATTLQRHEAELRRRDSERRFQQFMANVPGLAWIKDSQGRYLYANEAIAMAFGKAVSGLLGRTDADVMPAETAAVCAESDRRVMETRSSAQVLEPMTASDGSVRHMLVTKFPIPTSEPGVVLVGGIAIDATERIEAEEALRESDRRKDEFLAMLAHELRNPLAPVRNAAQILKRKGAGNPEISWAADMIERQAGHMTRLIDDLLDVSRITRGAIVLRKERLVLQDIARSVLETVRPLVEGSSHTLEVNLPATPILLDGDPTRVAQVLVNLLNNAAKYTPAGGRIRLDAFQEDGWAQVRVTDNGIGIPEAMLGRVFDLFVQVDNSLERAQAGLGIGLTMVKRLVEMHGGQVKAESAGQGRGSTFLVRLPVALTVVAASRDSPSLAQPEVQCRVLVVDDNRDSAASLGMLLELSGCQVQLAFDGVEALAAFPAFQPDLVILDIGLPKMNGYEVVGRLRAQPAGRAVSCLALTGFGKEEDRTAALAAGFDFHLTKPIAFDQLQDVLAKARAKRCDPLPVSRAEA